MEEIIFFLQTGITFDNDVYKASIAQLAGDNLATFSAKKKTFVVKIYAIFVMLHQSLFKQIL